MFGADVKPHLVHETVRAELNERRAGTRGAKSRGLVSGGRAKPWRQKGTGRARAGTTRAPHWTGGGVAFPPTMRTFDQKVNRKARRAALAWRAVGARPGRHARRRRRRRFVGAVDEDSGRRSSRRGASSCRSCVVCADDEENLERSFRNLPKVAVVAPSELEVAAVVWARSLLVSQAALEDLETRAGKARKTEKEEVPA